MDFPILMLKKGIIRRSSKMELMYLLFLVKAVGLTIELMTKSSILSPISLISWSLAQGSSLSLGNPRRGLVIIQPAMLIPGRSSKSLIVMSPPKLWAYMNRGRSYRASLNNLMTSFISLGTVEHPLGAPE